MVSEGLERSYPYEEFKLVWTKYHNELRARNAADFDDLLVRRWVSSSSCSTPVYSMEVAVEST